MSAKLAKAMQVFDDAALATLANPGLLRRAKRDLESGKIALESLEGETARLSVDGQNVSIGTSGPAAAECDCPAVGVCRHRLGAALFLRDVAGDEAEAVAAAEEEEPADPKEIIADISLDAARKFSGKPGWRAAVELAEEIETVEAAGTSISVKFASLEEPVLVLRGQGMAGIVSKASKAKQKAYHAAAVIAARRHFGLLEEEVEAEDLAPAAPAKPVGPDPEFLRSVETALADASQLAFNLAPESLEESLFALSVSSRADAMPRLAAILRGVAAQMRLKRARNFEFDASRMLELLATAFALTRAACNTPPDDPRFAKLGGQVRRDYVPAEPMELVGCGAEIWRGGTGARGVTAHFWNPESGRFHTVSLARGPGADPNFVPSQAFRQQVVWRAGPLEKLAHARVRLSNVGIAEDDRLSSGAGVRGEVLEEDVRPPSGHSDWAALHSALAQQFGRGVFATPDPQSVMLDPADVAKPFFDELAQRLVWPVRDGHGRWLALSLDHDDRSEQTIRRLEDAVRMGWRGSVLARAVPDGERIALSPVTLFGRDGPVDITIPPTWRAQQKETDFLGWLRRLKPTVGGTLAYADTSPSARAVDAAWRHVLDRLEAGPQLARLLDDKRTAHAARLTDYGMTALGELIGKADTGAHALAAAYALLVARQQRMSLPLLA